MIPDDKKEKDLAAGCFGAIMAQSWRNHGVDDIRRIDVYGDS